MAETLHVMSLGTRITIIQAANQAVTSNTTPQSSNTLTVNLGANKKYKVNVLAPFSLAGVLSGYKFQLSGPASPTNIIGVSSVLSNLLAVVATQLDSSFSSAFAGALATASTHYYKWDGVIENGSNAGALTVQFAQNTSDSSAITLLRGGYLAIEEVV
jgi:hypothetical protein